MSPADPPAGPYDPLSALDREGALLKAAARIAHIGAWDYDVPTRALRWSAETAAIHGLLPGDEPDLERAIDFYDEPSRPVIAAAVEAALRDGKPYDLELGFVSASGQRRWVRALGQAEQQDGRVVRLAGLFQDITTQRQAQEAIRELSERLRLATDVAGIGVWEWQMDSWTILWNEPMYRLHGLPADAGPIDAPHWLTLIHPDDHMLVNASWRGAYRDGHDYDTEHRLLWPDGSTHWVHSVGRLLALSPGQPRRMVGTCVDITDRRRHAQARLDQEAAERASRAKSEFLSRVSHELRTPLNGILGFAQLLQHGAALPAPQQRQVDLIRDAGEHLLQLVNDMLDLASIEAGQLRLSLEPVALAELVQASLALVQPLAQARGVSVELLPGADASHVLADRVRLRQVLVNLLSNAVKYNREQGRVRVSWRAGAPGQVELEVADTGRGLGADQLAALFQPFNRLGAEAGSVQGTGLGLAITQRLVQAMDARIAVRSAPGQGSTVSLQLPAAGPLPAPAADDRAAPPAAAPPGGTLRLLYVEDNPVNVLLMEQALALHGGRYMLEVATDGEQGLAALARARPDLLLLDINLPGLGGHEVLARVRADPRLAGLRCVAVSADAMPHEVARARAAGFDDYWTKPLDVARLAERIDAVLGRGAGGRDGSA